MDNDPHSSIDPTPAEIAERAAEIRAGWSVDEHIRRREYIPPLSYRDSSVEPKARFWAEERKTARQTAQRLDGIPVAIPVVVNLCDSERALG